MPGVSNRGLHKPNCFLVPRDIIAIAPKLSKEALGVLLLLLAGEDQDASIRAAALDELRKVRIIDRSGQIIWCKYSESIKLTMPRPPAKVAPDKGDQRPITEQVADLPQTWQTLWGYYCSGLKNGGIPITKNHYTSWLKNMQRLEAHPKFYTVIADCVKRRVGSWRSIEALLTANENVTARDYES